MRNTQIYIDSSALVHNLQRVRQLAPRSKIVSMVKSNGYGHGVEQVCKALKDSDAFGVACLEEAIDIRQFNSHTPISLMEGVFSLQDQELAIAYRCECAIHHQAQLDWLLHYQHDYQQHNLKVWVKLNSGMNRLGFSPAECIDVLQQLHQRGFKCVLTMHFANADDEMHPLNAQQIQQLRHVQQQCPFAEVSCCNSAAIFNWSDLHFDYVRPGIMLYGSSPFAERSAHDLGLRPAMIFTTDIIALHQLGIGEKVGYGSSVTTQRKTTLAIIAVGYGDGYPRAYQQQNYVSIDGHAVPLFGRVSMDMSMIDVTDLIAQGVDVQVGTFVELWGQHRSVDDVAACNGTIGYELLCRVTQRPYRVFGMADFRDCF
ncbi:MAG: alanine racemase [Acinetobacter sp.]|nr:alanine racemase [Acinetobacter sp.]